MRKTKNPQTRPARYLRPTILFVWIIALSAGVHAAQPDDGWKKIEPYFSPPAEFAGKMGSFRSPLLFEDGSQVKTAADWAKRRQEILAKWHGVMGAWPAVIEKPKLEILKETIREGVTQYSVKVQVSAEQMLAGYLLVPTGKGAFSGGGGPVFGAGAKVGVETGI